MNSQETKHTATTNSETLQNLESVVAGATTLTGRYCHEEPRIPEYHDQEPRICCCRCNNPNRKILSRSFWKPLLLKNYLAPQHDVLLNPCIITTKKKKNYIPLNPLKRTMPCQEPSKEELTPVTQHPCSITRTTKRFHLHVLPSPCYYP